jgi:hypothetical protein
LETVRTIGALGAAFGAGAGELGPPPTYISVTVAAAGCALGVFGAGVAVATCNGALVAGRGAGATDGLAGAADGAFALVVTVLVVVDFAAVFGFACDAAAVGATFDERAVAGIEAAGLAEVLEAVLEAVVVVETEFVVLDTGVM